MGRRRRQYLKGLLRIGLLAGLCAAFFLCFQFIAPALEKTALVAAAYTTPDGATEYIAQKLAQQKKGEEPSAPSVSENVSQIPKQEPSSTLVPPSTEEIQPLELPEDQRGGAIYEEKFKSTGELPKFIPIKNGYIKNVTKVTTEKILEEIQKKPEIKLDGSNGQPLVLIYHTHATESYDLYNSDAYQKDAATRSSDNSRNMVRVGDEICSQLDAAGIGYIHDTTQHDASYNGAYQRSKATAQQYLEKYPSIQIVLDIHRDAIYAAGDGWTKPVTEIGGKKAAQLMIIAGCDDGSGNLPHWNQNLRFAAMLQEQMETDYPTLTRPLLFDYRDYNQNLTPATLLIEVGSHGNFLGEAVYSGALIGKSLVQVIQNLQG